MKTRFICCLALATAAQAQAIEVFQAQSIEPYKARTVEPYKAQNVEPYKAQEIEVYRGRDLSVGQPTPRQQKSNSSGGDVPSLLGTWQTNVQGAVYQTPSNRPGYNVLHVSPGAQAGALVIQPNHTYTWNAYGGKRGRWQETGREDYPIALDDPSEKRTWLVGPQRQAGRIYIWDGNAFSYEGKRAQ